MQVQKVACLCLTWILARAHLDRRPLCGASHTHSVNRIKKCRYKRWHAYAYCGFWLKLVQIGGPCVVCHMHIQIIGFENAGTKSGMSMPNVDFGLSSFR